MAYCPKCKTTEGFIMFKCQEIDELNIGGESLFKGAILVRAECPICNTEWVPQGFPEFGGFGIVSKDELYRIHKEMAYQAVGERN